ncbi:TrmH family RNA methyltransferase [Aureisphaera galaxeae]|uniref:TrmH family RNA methyltransferase n=1 Tax=Aureisphaera galaxeae TaxID=1538023 RepID=UPI00234FDC13|nr:TrmH family RNA methyltransferase [Aureisphaera galaxeae]MDC8004166.1 TrmH family RNA methyltransferase [Aureisphaera galaxeae]
MNTQHTHTTTPFSPTQHPIVVICNQVTGPANIGGLFRICDAFGIERLVFDHEIDLTSPRLRKTARNTFSTVNHSVEEDLPTYIATLKEQGYRAIGLEITSESRPIQSLEFEKGEKITLVIGGERLGISESVLNALDDCAHIEMFGANSSMNVTQATAVALFELTKT